MGGRWLVAVALVVGVPGVARADLPAGRFGVSGGLRQHFGALGNSYGFGWMIGVEGGYHPAAEGRTYDAGVAWSVAWGVFGADDPELVEDRLLLLEMSLGLRLRRAISRRAPRYLAVTSGLSIHRTNVPVAPDDERTYIGGFAGLGVEQYVAGRGLLGLEARYGLIGPGPGSFSLVFSATVGSR